MWPEKSVGVSIKYVARLPGVTSSCYKRAGSLTNQVRWKDTNLYKIIFRLTYNLLEIFLCVYATNGVRIIHWVHDWLQRHFCSFRRYQGKKKLVENSRQDFGQRMKEAALGFLCYKLSIVMWSVGGGAESKLSDYINGQVDHTGSIRHISFPAGASWTWCLYFCVCPRGTN